MAHGGHHSSSHSHYHHHGSRSGGGEFTWIEGVIFIVCIIIFISSARSRQNTISNKQPLDGKYETYTPYLIDKNGYFSNPNELIAGLQYFHEHTNIQIVVMSSNESWSDSKVTEQYYHMFNDEAHVLIVVPVSWFSSTEYYAIGDLANTVFNDTTMDVLLDNIDGSRNGTIWNKYLKRIVDTMMSE